MRLKSISAMREAYRRELNCQIVHDSHHERGLLQSHGFFVDDVVVGYGSVNASNTVKEFYLAPERRALSLTLFRALLVHTAATAIEAQSNDPLLMPMLQACASDLTSETILFADGVSTTLTAPGAVLRKIRLYERPFIFRHTLEPVGDWGIECDRQIVATGGLFFHYNRPYGDIYMEVAPTHRRRGFGSFLVQELKRIARDGGHIPAARCNEDNTASQCTLRRAGMRACGRILRGQVAGPAIVFLGLASGITSSLRAQCPDGSPPPCAVSARTPAIAPHSIAVLYFENLSRDSADAHLSDGLTEEVTSRLGDLAQLQVKRPNRTAVRRLQDSLPDLAAVARVLRVRYLVEGSLRREGTRVRVSVRLIRDGFQVWAADYNRSTSGLLALQEEIAREVATGVAGRLAPADRAALGDRPTRSPEAYERFLRGNYYIGQRAPRFAARAIDEYEAALRLDPAFARARARLAYSYWSLLNFSWQYEGLPAESLLARGFQAVDAALRHDSSSSDAWMVRGSLLAIKYPKSYEGVRSAFERALSIDPGNAEAHHLFALELRYLGEDSAAIAEYHRALSIEPGKAVSLQGIGSVLFAARQYEAARQWFDSTLAVDPGYYLGYLRRARVRLQLGDTQEARRDAETAVRLGAGDELAAAVLAMAELRSGDSVAARARLDRALRDLPLLNRPGPGEVLFAAALAALGEHERALDFLERVQPRGFHFLFELRAPEFDVLRSQARFERLLASARR